KLRFCVVPAHVEVRRIVGSSSSVRQEMMDRDISPGFRPFREELAQLVIESEPSFLDKHHDQGRGELLTYRTGLKNRLRLHCNLMFDVRESITFGENDAAILNNGDGNAGYLRLTHFGLDIGIDRDRSVLRQTR